MSITFSSCFYIIKSKFDPSKYIEWMKNFLSIVNEFNLVIYTDEKNINITYSFHSTNSYGNDIDDNNLFLISNYCFTEIGFEHLNNYINYLFPKLTNGFIIWQTVFNLPISNVNMIRKNIINIIEEYPLSG